MKSITTSLKNFYAVRSLQGLNFSLLIVIFSLINLNSRAGAPIKLVSNTDQDLISSILISASGHNILLSWQVDKSAFNYYEVEKSSDGMNFSTIGLVLDAPENSNTCLFKEKKPSVSENSFTWYRIKGILKDGGVVYSSNSSYRESMPVSASNGNMFTPNPFSGTGSIKYFSDQVGFAIVKLQNTAGETLLSKQSVVNKGYNTIPVDGLSTLSTGVYVARLVINGTVMINQKIVKE